MIWHKKVTRHPLESEDKPYVLGHLLDQVDPGDFIGDYDHSHNGIKKGTCLVARASSHNTKVIIATGEPYSKWWVGPTS